MNTLLPNRDCPLKCKFRNTAGCVCNLVSVSRSHPAITFGHHIGLRQTYGAEGLPLCVRGPVGAAHWSTSYDGAIHASPSAS